jgi:hypothetical protein
MTQIQTIHSARSIRRESHQSRTFEAQYCGSANATTSTDFDPALVSHRRNAQKFLHLEVVDPRHSDPVKPRMWQCPQTKLWKCQIEDVAGTGTTKRAAWTQMWALLKITHPHLKKPEAK